MLVGAAAGLHRLTRADAHVQVFGAEELQLIADLCQKHDCLCLLDEVCGCGRGCSALCLRLLFFSLPGLLACPTRRPWHLVPAWMETYWLQVYEHLVFPGTRHTSLQSLPGMRERCLRVGSAGKTFSFTAWKVGASHLP